MVEATTLRYEYSALLKTGYLYSMVKWVESDNTGLGLHEESSTMSHVSFCPYRH